MGSLPLVLQGIRPPLPTSLLSSGSVSEKRRARVRSPACADPAYGTVGTGTSALNGLGAFLGAALGGRGLPRPACWGMPGSAGLFWPRCWQARLFWCWCWCCSPAKSIRTPRAAVRGRMQELGSRDRQCSSLLPQQSLVIPAYAMLLPAFGAFLQTKPKIIFQHVLHTGVVGQTQQLHSLFHVFTCLD